MVWSAAATASLAPATRTNSAITVPGGVQAGDIIRVVMYQEVNAAVATTPPSGFVSLVGGENASSTPDSQYLSWYKVADGNEGAGDSDLDFTHASVYSGFAVAWFRPTGRMPTLNVQSAAIQTSTASPLTLTAITTTKADCLITACSINFDEQDSSPPGTGGWAEAIETSGVNGGGPFIAWNEQAGAGTTGSVGITWVGAPIATVGALAAFEPDNFVEELDPLWVHLRM